jgi:hypothetical protein
VADPELPAVAPDPEDTPELPEPRLETAPPLRLVLPLLSPDEEPPLSVDEPHALSNAVTTARDEMRKPFIAATGSFLSGERRRIR